MLRFAEFRFSLPAPRLCLSFCLSLFIYFGIGTNPPPNKYHPETIRQRYESFPLLQNFSYDPLTDGTDWCKEIYSYTTIPSDGQNHDCKFSIWACSSSVMFNVLIQVDNDYVCWQYHNKSNWYSWG